MQFPRSTRETYTLFRTSHVENHGKHTLIRQLDNSVLWGKQHVALYNFTIKYKYLETIIGRSRVNPVIYIITRDETYTVCPKSSNIVDVIYTNDIIWCRSRYSYRGTYGYYDMYELYNVEGCLTDCCFRYYQ
jgi:hypothetical protein